jgi:Tol biopolymer transport system component
MTRTAFALLLAAAALAAPSPARPVTNTAPATARPATATRRPLRVEDLFQLKDVDDPRVSPDGAWVAYSVETLDAERDAADRDIYMVPFAGGEPIRLTTSEESESDPAWSPDGRWIAFLSGREGKKTQVWLLDRRGGEAFKLTDYKADVGEIAWAPDGKRLALVVTDPDPDDPDLQDEKGGDEEKAPKPIVIRRRQFKRDGQGYLTDRRDHLYVFDLATRKSTQVTSGPYDDAEPAWSPDGRSIAFTSNRTADPDANQNTDLYVVAATGGEPRRLTAATT